MNFKRYIEASDTWVDSHYIMRTSTDTITTLPAVLYPNDTTATVGLKGQTVQSSTPSPTSPVMPQETGERTENLFDSNTLEQGGVNDSTGGDAVSTARVRSTYIALGGGTRYSFKINDDTMVVRYVHYYDAQKQWLGKSLRGGLTSDFFDFPNDGKYIRLVVQYKQASQDITVSEAKAGNIMLNTGSTALPYEPYGYKLDILSGDTTTPVYLGEVETTRRIRKLVFDGTEDWKLWSSGLPDVERYYYKWDKVAPSDYGIICTHFPFIIPDGNYDHIRLGGSSREDFLVFISRTIAPTITDFKAYLQQQYAAGTPVTVWYVLATPKIAVVNEPLMKIGDYADEVANVSIPVTAGANTLSVDTTVQPSEVTVDYKGWHPVQNVHERDNGAWT